MISLIVVRFIWYLILKNILINDIIRVENIFRYLCLKLYEINE